MSKLEDLAASLRVRGFGPIDAAEELERLALVADQTQKKDAGKLPLELLPTRPLEAVARVLGFGACKYAANGWRAGIAYSRVYAAVLRHCWLWWRGEAIDPDSQEHHLACAACELLFLLEYELSPDAARRVACDDREGNDVVKGGTDQPAPGRS